MILFFLKQENYIQNMWLCVYKRKYDRDEIFLYYIFKAWHFFFFPIFCSNFALCPERKILNKNNTDMRHKRIHGYKTKYCYRISNNPYIHHRHPISIAVVDIFEKFLAGASLLSQFKLTSYFANLSRGRT